MNLEKGMYVRTKKGIYLIINNVQQVPEGYTFIDGKCINTYEISKASFNIIDLIEVGDFVNGWLVNEIWEDKIDLGDKNFACAYKFNFDKHYVWKDEIKSILTHEQYEANCYKVVE